MNLTMRLSLCLLVICLLLTGCGRGEPGASSRSMDADLRARLMVPASVPVEVATVTRGSIQRTYRTVTTLEAGQQTEVVARTSGVLERLQVEEGDLVSAGQVMAQLDIEQHALEVAQREATVARLRADLARSQSLFERQLGSAADVDNLRFELQAQQAQLDLAELRLRYATVQAPIAGLVTQRSVGVGNLIQTNQVMFEITDPDSIEAVLHLPQRELSQISVGQPVWLQLDALPGQRLSGRVARIRPQVDADTGTFRVVAIMDNPERQLMAGMFGRAEVVFDTLDNVLLINERALISRDDQTHVFVVRDGVARRVTIETGVRERGLVQIIAGLAEHEQVVVTGQQILEDGASVEIVRS